MAIKEQGECFALLSDDECSVIVEEERLAKTVRDTLPPAFDSEHPYFAHLKIEENDSLKDILIGYQSFVIKNPQLPIVHWATAPIAEIYYTFQEGEFFELELPARTLEGQILARRSLSFSHGKLVGIRASSGNFVRESSGHWRAVQDSFSGHDGGTFGTGQSNQVPHHVTALLDPEQHRIIRESPRRPLLILGSAGCGKTTVALSRLAYLKSVDPEGFDPSKALVIVPQTGLKLLSERLLEEFGLGEVRVATFDEWISEQAQRVFPELSERLYQGDVPFSVIRFKRHRALVSLIEGLVRPSAEQKRGFERFESIQKTFIEFLGDEEILEKAIEGSSGELTAAMASDVLFRLRRQIAHRTEQEYAHVDADRLKALDDIPLDEGTPDDVSDRFDVEDLPILFEILWRIGGRLATRSGKVARILHLVVDEAQEFAPAELAFLGRAVERFGTMIVAGDEAQHVDITACFGSWEQTLNDLRLSNVTVSNLKTIYRCTFEIAEFGQHVLGHLAPSETFETVHSGAPVLFSLFENPGERAFALNEKLTALMTLEKQARIAVIARDRESAEALFDVLRRAMNVRIVLDGAFSFSPGVDITDVSCVKGLEFDYVVVPDGGPVEYPEKNETRRALHVAATRAIHQLWIVSVGRWSPLIESFVEK